MTQLWVWAPKAERLEAEVAGRRVAMRRGERGHWHAEVPDLAHGIDYAFHVDGKGPFPDPRSPWQPGGVFGPSRHVDHARFAWSDGGFRAVPLAAAVIYELHIGTFTAGGTFDAAVERLAHLAALGVTHVEVMPVHEFSGDRGWGYDGVDLFAPHHAYGEPEAMKRFVNACHRAGMAVILDVVYNHFGPAGNFAGVFAPYFTGRYQTPWGPAVNLDGRGSDEVRRFVCDNALMWLRDYHVDGLRLDAAHEFQDHSSVHLLEQISREVKALEAEVGRPLTLIAESDYNDARMVRPLDAGGLGMDAQWNDDFHHALHALLTGERRAYYQDFGLPAHLAKAIEQVFVRDGGYVEFRQRSHGRPVGDTPRTRFIAYSQNHDQVGNRAAGDRPAAALSRGRLKIGAALTLAGPFVPMLFQGEEWGTRTPFQFFTDHRDEGLAQAVREGRRRDFGDGWDEAGRAFEVPDPQAEATFVRSKLDWSECETAAAREMLDWYRGLIALRRTAPRGRTPARVLRDDRGGWMIVECSDVAVAFNIGREDAHVTVPEHWPRAWALAMRSDEGVRLDGETLTLTLPVDGCAVLAAAGTTHEGRRLQTATS